MILPLSCIFGVDDAILWSGALGAGANLLGGLFGSSSQERANKANIEMQRETNALNKQMFDEQMQYNWDMFNATNQYNSPENQRRLLEEAGYNPALLQGANANASPLNSPQGHAAQVGNPIMPVDAMAKGVSNAVGNAAQIMQMITQSNKNQAEKTAVDIDNITRGAINSAKLEGYGLDNEGKFLANFVKDQTLAESIKKARVDNELTEAATEQARSVVKVNSMQELLYKSGIQLNEKQIEQIASVIDLNAEKIITEKTIQELNKITGDARKTEAIASLVSSQAEMLKAKTGAYLAPSQKSYYESAADANTENAWKTYYEGEIVRKYGKGAAAVSILNALIQGKKDNATIKYIMEQCEHEHIEVRWSDIEHVLDVGNSFKNFFSFGPFSF